MQDDACNGLKQGLIYEWNFITKNDGLQQTYSKWHIKQRDSKCFEE